MNIVPISAFFSDVCAVLSQVVQGLPLRATSPYCSGCYERFGVCLACWMVVLNGQARIVWLCLLLGTSQIGLISKVFSLKLSPSRSTKKIFGKNAGWPVRIDQYGFTPAHLQLNQKWNWENLRPWRSPLTMYSANGDFENHPLKVFKGKFWKFNLQNCFSKGDFHSEGVIFRKLTL